MAAMGPVTLTVGTLFARHMWSGPAPGRPSSYLLKSAPVEQAVGGTVVHVTVLREPRHGLDQQDLWYVVQSSPVSSDIQIDWMDSPNPKCGMVIRAHIAEDAARLVIQLTTDRDPYLSCAALGREATTVLHLSNTLGTRSIDEYLPPGFS